MPELPDVEVSRRYMEATSLHQTIKEVEVKSPNMLGNVTAQQLRQRLIDSRFDSTRRHGKHLLARLDQGRWLTLHFGMTGYLDYFRHLTEERPHDRLLISFANGFHLAYVCQRMLGGVGLAEDIRELVTERNLGPDALEVDFRVFLELVGEKRGAIKSALLDQHLIAGIGNIYADEILFQAGLRPQADIDRLDGEDLEELFKRMKQVLQTAIDSKVDPERFPHSYLLPYRDKEGRCPRCAGKLDRTKVSGRTTYYCPRCQPSTE